MSETPTGIERDNLKPLSCLRHKAPIPLKSPTYARRRGGPSLTLWQWWCCLARDPVLPCPIDRPARVDEGGSMHGQAEKKAAPEHASRIIAPHRASGRSLV